MGCGRIDVRPATQGNAPERIDYSGYQKTLDAYVRDGLVRYKKLKDDIGELDDFIVSLAYLGPCSTPEIFNETNEQTAFWINVYNAAALRAAVEKYPTQTVKSFWKDFEKSTRVMVDSRQLTLAQIADLARQAGANDPRVEPALSLPALGSPKLSIEVFQGSRIDHQLDQAVARAIEDSSQVRVDHENRALGLGQALFRVQDRWIAGYCQKYKTSGASMVNALADFADETQRRRLNAALGYRVVKISFDWSLNEKEEPSCSLDQ